MCVRLFASLVTSVLCIAFPKPAHAEYKFPLGEGCTSPLVEWKSEASPSTVWARGCRIDNGWFRAWCTDGSRSLTYPPTTPQNEADCWRDLSQPLGNKKTPPSEPPSASTNQTTSRDRENRSSNEGAEWPFSALTDVQSAELSSRLSIAKPVPKSVLNDYPTRDTSVGAIIAVAQE